jgi:hypothetical protein
MVSAMKQLKFFFSLALLSSAISFAAAGNFEGEFQRYWITILKGQKSYDTLTIRKVDEKLIAVYNGEEDLGEHGVSYFRAEIREIGFNPDGAISFSMPPYELYAKPIKDGVRQKKIGAKNSDARFVGHVEGENLVFSCVSSVYDCPELKLLFKRIK